MIGAQAVTVSATLSKTQPSSVPIDSKEPLAAEMGAVAPAPAGASTNVTAKNDPLGGASSAEPTQAATEAATTSSGRRRRGKKQRQKAKTAAPVATHGRDVHRSAGTTASDMHPTPDPTPSAALPLEYQTDPPSFPVSHYFPSGVFPAGELHFYRDDRTNRTLPAEVREHDRLDSDVVNALRHAAEAHRRVRGYMADHIRPGVKLLDICERLEAATRVFVGASGLDAGIAFPTGCSVNHVAAHFTPNAGDETVLGVNDLLKVDFGTHVSGRIINSAWSVAFHPRYDPLVAAVRSATEAGIAAAGIDVRLGDIGAAIQEVMESHEVELDGVMRPIRCVRNLNGHSIRQYQIHGGVSGKSVPIVRAGGTTKMEEGESYAIETFGSTGRGYVVEGGECSHYMLRDDPPRRVPLRLPRARSLLATIEREFGTLAFCRRYLDRLGERRYAHGLKALCDAGMVNPCPPLVEAPGSYVAQFEHTILLGPTHKEVLSRGADY